ncbi:uncharacterized protein MKK02DRAFT_39340 [Dioszegia hungarica]|uniref:RRM domain-containing protein n=1 Tax=Dioszegia hungarica TaxID=4972 RepID=A0AA38LTH1_9TREE|nr:uncharacterized protein MKK02DRAFT_39340 [Dioszegia hungarica]KAI9633359.1 hypothetical protein MKK02DRAFT_39340 [Dioszegia hungarica]
MPEEHTSLASSTLSASPHQQYQPHHQQPSILPVPPPARQASAPTGFYMSGEYPQMSGHPPDMGYHTHSGYYDPAYPPPGLYADPSLASGYPPPPISAHVLGQLYDAQQQPTGHLPPVSSSPPPTVPQYVPPPQHQMAPDPIHTQATQNQAHQASGWGWRPPPQFLPPHGPSYPGQAYGPPLRVPPIPNEAGSEGRSSARGSMSTPPGMMRRYEIGERGPGGMGGRDRRRRDRDEDRDGGEDEVISTIFVVGFPDDMTEREFQNIFTFAPGFEAATLKFPSGSRTREPTAALLAELSHLAVLRDSSRTRETSEEHQQQMAQHQAGLEEALAALQMAAGGTASTSTSTTPSGAISLTPAVPSAPTLGGIAAIPTRRQIIGFARFKTRADALQAREQLQGRKIDTLTGASLKAEMAKKNLHTKRATSGEELVGLLLRSGRLAGLVNGVGGDCAGSSRDALQGRDGSRGGMGGYREQQAMSAPSAKEAWDNWPLPPHMATPAHPPLQQPGGPDSGRTRQSTSEDQLLDRYPSSLPSPYLHAPGSAPGGPNSFPPGASTNRPPPSGVPFDPTAHPSYHPADLANPTSPPSSARSPIQPIRPSFSGPSHPVGDSKALLALAEEADELELEMELMTVGEEGTGDGGLEYRLRQAGRGSMGGGYGGFGYAMPGMGGGGRGEMLPTSPTGTSEALSDAGRSMGNPSDQNPPINTLYIGNLPAISPPTHPPNFLEESLRSLFARLPGFKRMSFRQKINGPMCFVEFEDVGYATLAIKENGLVKGGIRLSYSKNSLGQRGQSQPQGLGSSMFGGIAHNVAMAGMSPSPTTTTDPSNHRTDSVNSPSFSSLGLSSSRANDGTTLSPTAQPFMIPTPSLSSGSASNQATSPRSRYFGGSEPRSPGSNFAPGSIQSNIGGLPVPAPGGNGGAGSSAGSSAASPKWTPATVSWLSPGSAGNGYGGGDGFPSSLGGVASTWGSV